MLAFPGIFRGALNVRARRINEAMKLAAAHTIAGCIERRQLSPEYIVPSVFNREVVQRVAAARHRSRDQERGSPERAIRQLNLTDDGTTWNRLIYGESGGERAPTRLKCSS